jgi:hypothetical protein
MDAHAKNFKIGNVAFNGKGPGGEKWHVQFEAKCYESNSDSVLRGMAVSFFTKILGNPAINQGIYITKDAFDPFGTFAGFKQQTLSDLVINTEKRLGFIKNILILDLNTLIRPSQDLTLSTIVCIQGGLCGEKKKEETERTNLKRRKIGKVNTVGEYFAEI